MLLTIARREWIALFLTPLGWWLLAGAQAVLAWVFLRVLDRFVGVAIPPEGLGLNRELAQHLYGAGAVLLLLAAPLLASRSLSGERREGTDQLLGAAPLGTGAWLLGKFLGLALPLVLVAVLPLALVLTLTGVAPLDLGLFLAATLGLGLLALLFGAVGLYAASLTAQPALAAVLAYALLVLLSLVNRGQQMAAAALPLLDWLSWNQHLFWLLTGVVRLSDLAYFLLMTGLFLALAERRLANRRFG